MCCISVIRDVRCCLSGRQPGVPKKKPHTNYQTLQNVLDSPGYSQYSRCAPYKHTVNYKLQLYPLQDTCSVQYRLYVQLIIIFWLEITNSIEPRETRNSTTESKAFHTYTVIYIMSNQQHSFWLIDPQSVSMVYNYLTKKVDGFSPGRQWAAVNTHHGSMRVPPQN